MDYSKAEKKFIDMVESDRFSKKTVTDYVKAVIENNDIANGIDTVDYYQSGCISDGQKGYKACEMARVELYRAYVEDYDRRHK